MPRSPCGDKTPENHQIQSGVLYNVQGAGGESSDMKRRGELRMIERAVNQGWDVPDAERQRSIAFAAEVLDDPRATDREKLTACRVMIAMEGARFKAEKMARDVPQC